MRFTDFVRWTRGQAPEPRTPQQAAWEARVLTRAKLRYTMRADYPDPADREIAIRFLMGEAYPDDGG